MRHALVLAVLTLLLSAACESESPEELTEVVVQIFADEQVQQAGDKLIVELLSGPSVDALEDSEPVIFEDGFRWPVSIALVAKRTHEKHVFELNLRLEKGDETVARGRVQSGFVQGQTVVLQTSLDAECLGKLDCPPNETCVVEDGRAVCQSAAVDAGALPGPDDPPPSHDAGTAPRDAGALEDAGGLEDAGRWDAGACGPGSLEDCHNGLDDDCDGDVDCADEDCTEVTQCVPNALSYVLVGETEACPDGYAELDLVYQELNDPGCESCSCKPDPKQCSAYVWIYTDADSCDKDVRPYQYGTMLRDPASSDCSLPIGKEIGLPSNHYGFRVEVSAEKDSCTPGAASTRSPSWSVTRKRCSQELRRHGCRFGSFCAPRAPQLCWSSGAESCAIPELAQTYFLNYTDERSCQCSCAIKEPGTCKDVGATLTTDTTCRVSGGTELRSGQKQCETISSDAVARRIGAPQDPSCSSNTLQVGGVVPGSPLNLCCRP
jgi:hypothetical protein